MKKIPTVTWS